MAWQELARGGLLDASKIESYESYIGEGQRGLLELTLRAPVPSFALEQLRSELVKARIKEVQVTTGSPVVRISWRKGFPFLPVILMILLGIVALAILVVGWGFFREIAEVIPKPIIAGGAILALAVLALFAWQRRKA